MSSTEKNQVKFDDIFRSVVMPGDALSISFGSIEIIAELDRDPDAHIDDDDVHNVDQKVTCIESEETQAALVAARGGFERGEWFYGVITITCNGEHVASLGGIECNYPTGTNDYLTDLANEMLNEHFAAMKTQWIDETKRTAKAIVGENGLFSAYEQALIKFATFTLLTMENEMEWSADTLDEIDECARELKLATTNERSEFVRSQELLN